MVVMTGSSLTKRSLAKRISRKTICRPTVKLTQRNRAIPARLWPNDHRSIARCDARPKTTAMMIQPIESSIIAEARMICPRSRRMKSISRTTIATILTEEMDSATPRKSAVTSRVSGRGINASGSDKPSSRPPMNGKAMPTTDTLTAARPTLRISRMSMSMPVSSSSKSTPNWPMAASIAFCAGSGGNSACCICGHRGQGRTGRAGCRRSVGRSPPAGRCVA